MDSTTSWGLVTTLIGGVCTLAIFSFLLKENPFYRFFEHLFIGIAAGLGPLLVLRDFLWPKILEPMLGLTITTYPDGTLSEPYQPLYLLYLVPMAFGSLYYFIYSRRHAWLAKIVIGFTLGTSGALAIRGFFGEVIPQITGSFKPLVVFSNGEIALFESFNNILFVATLLLVLNYFFFSFGKDNSAQDGSPGTLQSRMAPLGRPLLMICFGAFFGSTVMARLALLVERVQFIITDWVAALSNVVGIG
ncbi:MAG: hypothetical protein NTV65_04220 [Proteobacteria bacterium]|nr:hypothetical protein [Pseudomonadota bacterium]